MQFFLSARQYQQLQLSRQNSQQQQQQTGLSRQTSHASTIGGASDLVIIILKYSLKVDLNV